MATSVDLNETATQANARRMREAFEAFDRGDLEHLRTNSTEDATWTNSGSSPIAGTYRGWSEIEAMLGKVFELTGGTYKTRVVSILANDNQSACIYDATATVKGKTETHRFIPDSYQLTGRAGGPGR